MDGKAKERIGYAVGLLLIVILSILFSVYYYTLHLGFTPNGEELTSVVKAALGGKSSHITALWDWAWQLAAQNFGLTYKALRAGHTIMYFFIVSAAFVLAMTGRSGRLENWHAVPLFAFLMAVLHTGGSKYYGQLDESLHQYPFDNHVLPTIYALWTLICIGHYLASQGKKKYFWLALTLVLAVTGVFRTDVLYCIMLVAPVLAVAAGEFLKKRQDGLKLPVRFLFGIVAVIFAMRVVYYVTPFLLNVFSTQAIAQYQGRFYGDANFADLGEAGRTLLEFVAGLMGLFNIDWSNKPLIHVFSVIYLVRLILIALVIYFMYSCLKKWLRDSGKERDYLDLILTLGILFISLAVLLSSIRGVRYMVGILPYATILLCRNFSKVNQWLKLDQKRFTVGVFLFFAMCSFIYAKPVNEMKKNPDIWDDEYEEVLRIIQEEELGTGVGSLWIAPILTCLSGGEHMVYAVETDRGTKNMSFFLEEAEKQAGACSYIIQGTQDWKYVLLEEQTLEEYYGKPATTYQTAHFTIYAYDYDISARFRDRDGY